MIPALRIYIQKRFKHYHVGEQFIKYCLVGVANTTVDFLSYLLLTRLFVFWKEHFLAANIIAFLIANMCSFFLNKHFTFQNKTRNISQQYSRFFIVSIIYIALVQSLLFIGVEQFGMYDVVAKVIATAIGLIWNFIAHKYWSFKDTMTSSQE